MTERARVRPALWFAAMVALTLIVTGLAVQLLPMNPVGTWRASTSVPWLDGLCRWDSGWFNTIAVSGYWYEPGRQSPVAFYPLYPLLIATLAPIVRSYFLTGILITMASGFGVIVLAHRWTSARFDTADTSATLLALLLFPFSVYLFGAAYSDALFTCATLGAFTCLEHDRPWLAGFFGAAATATRPVGLAVVIGLAVRAAERRGAFGRPGARVLHLDALRIEDAAVLCSVLGAALYWAFLWHRFGDPLAWVHAAAAPGWFVLPGPAAWFKVKLLDEFTTDGATLLNGVRVLHVALLTLAVATVPAVWRRFGIGYAVYAAVVLAIPTIASPDLFGSGRYILPAFPCFAIAGRWLCQHPRLARVALPVSLALQIAITALAAAWYPVS